MPKRCVYFPNQNVFITHIEKCGCQSTRILALKEYNKFKRHGDIWNNNIIGNFIKTHPLNINKTTLLIIKRNPYDRIVSGYISKIVNAGKPLNFISNMLKHYNRKWNDNIRVSFEEFIDYIILKEDQKLDIHFMPQYLHVRPHLLKDKNAIIIDIKDNVKINEFLKNNNFKETFPEGDLLYQELDVKYSKKDFNEMLCDKSSKYIKDLIYKNGRKEITFPLSKNFYNPKLKEKVYNYYKTDFTLFGYDK